ncbi:MAG: exosortase-associated EpsI family protein [Verrucomicrobiota bacterium]
MKTKYLWIALIAAILLATLWERFPLADASKRLQSLPHNSLLMESRDMPMTPAEQANFSGTTVIKRFAAAGRDRIILTVVDGTHDRHAIHDPVFCFRGAGWEVDSMETLPLEKGDARIVRLRQGTRTAEALYWFTDGRRQFANPVRFWWQTSLRRLTFGASGEEPVLVILTSTGETTPNWTELLHNWPDVQKL